MWLVLSAQEDPGVDALAERLRQRGLDPLIHANAEDIGLARWSYRTGGTVESSEVLLPNGVNIASSRLRGVLNRLYAVPATALAQVERADRGYATEELLALYTSWLYGLACPVINRPTATGLCGPWPDRSWWVARALSAGLPVAAWRWQGVAIDTGQDSEGPDTETLLLLDGQVVEGRAPVDLLPACTRLAERSKTRLLGLTFLVTPTAGWQFFDATPMPDLSSSGNALADAVASALTRT